MTVADVMRALTQFDPQANVYVPDILSDKAEIAQSVSVLVHLNCPKGITIPPDVCITPWTDEEFQKLFGHSSDV